jgi:hypothetical protein
MALSDLWLPILASAVLVFVASALIHMALPWHKNEYPALPDEARARAALGPLAIPPGDYMLPRCANQKEMNTPEFKEKLRQGPVAILTVLPNGEWGMGRYLSQWFVYCLVVSLFTAYIGARTLPAKAPYMAVFQIVAVTAFMGYSLALWQMSIWWRRAWSTTLKATVDGAVYAMVTAGAFGWLWPR